MKEPGLTDLIDKSILQQFQDAFSEFTGMAALITDEKGYPVTKGSGFTDFCMKLTRGTEKGRMRCAECDKNGALMTLRNGKPVVYRCHAGLFDFASPIMVDGKFIGSIIGGQVRPPEVDNDSFSKAALELGIDPEAYLAAAEMTYVLEESRVEKAAQFLYEIAQILSGMAYNNNLALTQSRKLERAARSQSAYIMNMSISMKKNISDWMSVAKQAVDSEDSNIMKNSIKELLNKSSDVHSMVGDTVDYIRMAGGDVELTETMYDPNSLVAQISESVKDILGQKGISLIIKLDSSVPDFILGDMGKIGQVVNKLITGTASFSEESSDIFVDLSCRKLSYSTVLDIKITSSSFYLPQEDLESFISIFSNSSGFNYIDEGGNSDLSVYNIAFLIRQMSGALHYHYNENSSSSIILSIPQLEVNE